LASSISKLAAFQRSFGIFTASRATQFGRRFPTWDRYCYCGY
jgi:hypothetical protein